MDGLPPGTYRLIRFTAADGLLTGEQQHEFAIDASEATVHVFHVLEAPGVQTATATPGPTTISSATPTRTTSPAPSATGTPIGTPTASPSAIATVSATTVASTATSTPAVPTNASVSATPSPVGTPVADAGLLVRLVAPTGEVLPAGCVELFAAGTDDRRGADVIGACDGDDGSSDGRISLAPLVAGRYVVANSHPSAGHRFAPDTAVELAGGAVTTITITAAPGGGSVIVTTVNARGIRSGDGCYGVFATGIAGGEEPRQLEIVCDGADWTDVFGDTEIDGLAPGHYVLRRFISGAGFASGEAEIAFLVDADEADVGLVYVIPDGEPVIVTATPTPTMAVTATSSATLTATPQFTASAIATTTATRTPVGIPSTTATTAATPTDQATSTATPELSASPTASGTPDQSASPSATVVPSSTATPVTDETAVATPTDVATVTAEATATGTATVTPTASATPPVASRPRVALSKAKSKFNGIVQASLTGFTPGATVTLNWPDGTALATTTANGSGIGVASFRTPLVAYGTYRVAARDTAGKSSAANLSVIPRVLLNEVEGPVTTRLRVYFYGFSAGERVEVRWYATDGASFEVLKIVTIASNGRGSSLVTIPRRTGAGDHKVMGRVIGVARSASATFEVTAAASVSVADRQTVTATPASTHTPTTEPVMVATSTPVQSTATATGPASPTEEPLATPTPTASSEPTATPIPTPTVTHEPEPALTATPTPTPTPSPSPSPTSTDTPTPTAVPTPAPTPVPAPEPTPTDEAVTPELGNDA